MKKIIWIFIGLSFITCQPQAGVDQKMEPTFFDLKTYFQNEAERLATFQYFTKTTQINGEKESHDFATLNFKEELALFMDADINRLAWVDQYKVDSVYSAQGTLTALDYTALKTDLQTQQVHIDFVENEPTFFRVNRLMENALMNAAMILEYRPQQSYRIQSNQKLRLSEEREMIVEVEWN